MPQWRNVLANLYHMNASPRDNFRGQIAQHHPKRMAALRAMTKRPRAATVERAIVAMTLAAFCATASASLRISIFTAAPEPTWQFFR